MDSKVKGGPAARSVRARPARATSSQQDKRKAEAAAPAPGALPFGFSSVQLPGGVPQAQSPQELGAGLLAMFQTLGGLRIDAQALACIQADYTQEAARLWNEACVAHTLALPQDRRFKDKSWVSDPVACFNAANYLLNARTLMRMADAVQGDAKTRARLRFGVQQWIDATAPSNYLALNPEAQRKAVESQGQSIALGLQHLLSDLRRGYVSQTDESVFEVGRNVATSAGDVVYENELFQLIEYKPLTDKVHTRPMLFVPPCINKFYILDLQPENSLIRYTVEQGHRVFVVSWRNPDASLAAKTWDDYIGDGAIRSLRVVQEITGQPSIDTLGFCVGGTILATALAVLSAHGEQPAASLTLLTTFLDFTDTGVLDLFVDEGSVALREVTIGAAAPGGPSLLDGKELGATFSFLRPNDLVWNYVVGNYLKGETPPPFDLLYWNSDSTSLPGPMYCWYLRNTYLENKLKQPGALTVCGVPVDLGAIQAPTYLYASREDHIVPWQSAYMSTAILKGPKRFVLGASGHIAGVVNPPALKKRSHWIGPEGQWPANADEWLAASTEHPGSWWTDWAAWLKPHAGPLKAAPKVPGSSQYQALEPAPGRYVKQKAG